MTIAAAPAEPAEPPHSKQGAIRLLRVQVLGLLGQLARVGLHQLLGMMVAVSESVADHVAKEGRLWPKEGLATHAMAKLARLARLRRIARWIPMLVARIKANPLLCLVRPDPPPPPARRAPRRPPVPVESPAGFARMAARLAKLMPLFQDPTRDDARDDARALERALARRGVAGIIAGFCRDLRIDVAPIAALFSPPWPDGSPLEDLLPEFVSVAAWLARQVADALAAPPAAGGAMPEAAASPSPVFSSKA